MNQRHFRNNKINSWPTQFAYFCSLNHFPFWTKNTKLTFEVACFFPIFLFLFFLSRISFPHFLFSFAVFFVFFLCNTNKQWIEILSWNNFTTLPFSSTFVPAKKIDKKVKHFLSKLFCKLFVRLWIVLFCPCILFVVLIWFILDGQFFRRTKTWIRNLCRFDKLKN